MRLMIQGLTFETITPSAYRLVSVRDDVGCGDTVDVAFTGMSWAIVYTPAGREPLIRPFESRDAAVSLIASRRAA